MDVHFFFFLGKIVFGRPELLNKRDIEKSIGNKNVCFIFNSFGGFRVCFMPTDGQDGMGELEAFRAVLIAPRSTAVNVCDNQQQNSAPPDEATGLEHLYVYLLLLLLSGRCYRVRLSRIQAIMGSNFAPQTGFLSVT
jgi:hypothetical protein